MYFFISVVNMAPTPMRLRIKLRSPNHAETSTTESSAIPSPRRKSTRLSGSTEQDEGESNPSKRQQSHRQKLKEMDPEAYKLLLLTDAQKQENRREKWSASRKKEESEASKLRMRKMRQKKKEESAMAQLKQKTTKEEKQKQQKELEDTKRNNREYQMARRAKFSQEKKEELNAKRREKRRQDREALIKYRQKIANAKAKDEERKRKEKEHLEKLQAEERRLDALEQELEKNTAGEGRSESARRQSLARARAAIPKTPEAYADTMEDLHKKTTPRKSAALKTRGIGSGSGNTCRKAVKNNQMDHLIGSALKEQLAKLKGKTKPNLATKRQLVTVLSSSKHFKLQTQACRRFGVSSKNISKVPRKFRYKNKHAVNLDTKRTVQKFYELNSIELPDKKSVSRKSLKKTRILEKPIKALHASFLRENPGIKVGLTSFFKLRPTYVRKVGDIKFRGCLCEYCENITLKLKTLNRACDLQLQKDFKINDIHDLVSLTMCPLSDDDKYHSKECRERQCENCGVKKLMTHFDPLDKTSKCKWNHWETAKQTVPGKAGPKEVVRRVRKLKEGTVDDVLTELKEEINNMSQHLFFKTWQQRQFSSLTSSKLPEGWCVMVLDFAENYTAKAQDEIQAAHWTQEQVTVHPIICYYNCNNPTCQNLKPIMHSVVFLSDDLTHDHHAVHTFSSKAINIVKETQPITKIIRFSDGCSTQYKSKGPFVDISHSVVDSGIPMQHDYFGSRHGKGPSDGESAVVKRKSSMAEQGHQAAITNAREMYAYCKESLTKNGSDDASDCTHFKRTIEFIPRENINRARKRDGKTLKGTRHLHSVKTIRPGVVAYRNLSCFCNSCVSGFGDCANKVHVDPWKTACVTSKPPKDKKKRGKGEK